MTTRKLLWMGTVLVGAFAPARAAELPSTPPAGADRAAVGAGAETAAVAPHGGEGATAPGEGATALGREGAATPGGEGAAAPRRRVLEEAPPAPERTPRPAAAEWDGAEPVELARNRSGAACKARMRREWLRIDCGGPPLGAVRTLGASAGEEWFRLDKQPNDELASGVSVVFPVRIGDRRVIEILSASFEYRGETVMTTSFVISEQWLDGDAGPLVSVL
ncbi:hypothetical protein [Sorangium sp. So ce1024]|uniref:hypothetical protein n=1 Tax=unclassified Sorangium TaxID=2621164 RepID=UPI003F1006EF